jgi:hypothetical protein
MNNENSRLLESLRHLRFADHSERANAGFNRQINAFEFVGDKSVNVYVSNNGDAPSKRYVLELAVRKIGNAHVARVTTAIIPGLRPGKFAKISVDATNILPNTVNLKDTTNLNAQPNENNNEKWHNLP